MKRNDEYTEHLDIAILERYLHDELSGVEREKVKGHLEICPLCRVELKSLKRFEEIDRDEHLAREADWATAEKLIDGWAEEWGRERIGAGEVGGVESLHERKFGFGIIVSPLVAAALLVLMFIGIKGSLNTGMHEFSNVMRSGTQIERQITLVAPSGDIMDLSDAFVWDCQHGDYSFRIDIFTAELTAVFSTKGIKGSSFKVKNIPRYLLKPGTIYMWRVSAYKGNERVSVSKTQWFRIVKNKLKR